MHPRTLAHLGFRHVLSLAGRGLHRLRPGTGSPVFDPGWLRPAVASRPYPPYHRGPYLEQFFQGFHDRRRDEFRAAGWHYLPISWTNIYTAGRDLFPLQRYLDLLDRCGSYFTVSQHDDAPAERLPPNTIAFNAGGRAPGVPIPLICSPIPEPARYRRDEKRHLCSFVGSLTHVVRRRLHEALGDRDGFHFRCRERWAPDVGAGEMDEFLETTGRSVFTLCPRGYGRSSFRLYEAMQLGSVPVVVYDDYPWLPWRDRVDWDRLCVLVPAAGIPALGEILHGYGRERVAAMVAYAAEIYPAHFTLQGCCERILDVVRAAPPPVRR